MYLIFSCYKVYVTKYLKMLMNGCHIYSKNSLLLLKAE